MLTCSIICILLGIYSASTSKVDVSLNLSRPSSIHFTVESKPDSNYLRLIFYPNEHYRIATIVDSATFVWKRQEDCVLESVDVYYKKYAPQILTLNFLKFGTRYSEHYGKDISKFIRIEKYLFELVAFLENVMDLNLYLDLDRGFTYAHFQWRETELEGKEFIEFYPKKNVEVVKLTCGDVTLIDKSEGQSLKKIIRRQVKQGEEMVQVVIRSETCGTYTECFYRQQNKMEHVTMSRFKRLCESLPKILDKTVPTLSHFPDMHEKLPAGHVSDDEEESKEEKSNSDDSSQQVPTKSNPPSMSEAVHHEIEKRYNDDGTPKSSPTQSPKKPLVDVIKKQIEMRTQYSQDQDRARAIERKIRKIQPPKGLFKLPELPENFDELVRSEIPKSIVRNRVLELEKSQSSERPQPTEESNKPVETHQPVAIEPLQEEITTERLDEYMAREESMGPNPSDPFYEALVSDSTYESYEPYETEPFYEIAPPNYLPEDPASKQKPEPQVPKKRSTSKKRSKKHSGKQNEHCEHVVLEESLIVPTDIEKIPESYFEITIEYEPEESGSTDSVKEHSGQEEQDDAEVEDQESLEEDRKVEDCVDDELRRYQFVDVALNDHQPLESEVNAQEALEEELNELDFIDDFLKEEYVEEERDENFEVKEFLVGESKGEDEHNGFAQDYLTQPLPDSEGRESVTETEVDYHELGTVEDVYKAVSADCDCEPTKAVDEYPHVLEAITSEAEPSFEEEIEEIRQEPAREGQWADSVEITLYLDADDDKELFQVYKQERKNGLSLKLYRPKFKLVAVKNTLPLWVADMVEVECVDAKLHKYLDDPCALRLNIENADGTRTVRFYDPGRYAEISEEEYSKLVYDLSRKAESSEPKGVALNLDYPEQLHLHATLIYSESKAPYMKYAAHSGYAFTSVYLKQKLVWKASPEYPFADTATYYTHLGMPAYLVLNIPETSMFIKEVTVDLVTRKMVPNLSELQLKTLLNTGEPDQRLIFNLADPISTELFRVSKVLYKGFMVRNFDAGPRKVTMIYDGTELVTPTNIVPFRYFKVYYFKNLPVMILTDPCLDPAYFRRKPSGWIGSGLVNLNGDLDSLRLELEDTSLYPRTFISLDYDMGGDKNFLVETGLRRLVPYRSFVPVMGNIISNIYCGRGFVLLQRERKTSAGVTFFLKDSAPYKAELLINARAGLKKMVFKVLEHESREWTQVDESVFLTY
ncbi:conserved hypothetical protein [Theileria orientalis strain Shintoku]|uniref:Uncharacterized protein n=1 Tax=Theileria orientalis strain Shintoku TaxID=869250 RepID=J4D9E0_THEOR|nr:conserved hypothetical protein [Theileria orientalis strain Shintoku]BAM41320.1 conserved hypothetical protein [Theileria orientalis strain Shintoku]|eukprot:XP_009691621.1 conserved hypothetical protein [Theileria orientalis strain Shintoku]